MVVILAVFVQFWYTDETAGRVADEILRIARNQRVACMACPSLFRKLEESQSPASIHLFEYDSRFAVRVLEPYLVCMETPAASKAQRQHRGT